MKTLCRYLFYLTFPLATLAVVTNVRAQSITSDGTLSTQVQSNDNLNFDITQGNRQGNNLFHSFRDFSVPDNGSARFLNGTDIANIFSRVTGGNISQINGLLQSQGTANLFLINPSGIVFGPNASLNIGGSFFGSTASGILFNDGVEFSATDTQPSPLLSVNIPIGLRFRDNPGTITNQSVAVDGNNNPVGLQFLSGKTLALVGGDVNFEGGRVTAPGAKVEIGGLSTEGIVGINDDLSLSFPEGVARGDVSLINGGIINVTAGDGGFLTVNTRNLEVREGSQLLAGIGSGLGTPQAQAGDIIINATDNVLFDNNSFAFNDVNSNGVGNAGNVSVTTGSLQLLNGGIFSASTLGQGNSGKVSITARDNISFDNGSIFNNVLSNAVGKSGGIDITTGSLSMTNGARMQSATVGQGDSGKINITARDNVSLDNGSSLFNNVLSSAVGNSGGVDITTGSLSVTNGSIIQSSTAGTGNSGKVKIVARDTVSFDGRIREDTVPSAIFTRVTGEFDGVNGETRSSGGIEISTGSLSITNRAQLGSTTRGKGNPGDIVIDARDQVFLSNTIIISEVTEVDENTGIGGIGDAGDIKITTGSLILKDGSSLLADTENIGNAGNIIIDARDSVILEGRGPGAESNSTRIVSSQITTTVESIETTTEGEGGNINISTGLLSIKDEGFIRSFTEGVGNAGDITVNARDIKLFNSSSINGSVRPGSTGIGGDINLNGQTLTLTNGSQVISQTSETGDAGNIKLTIKDKITLSGSESGIFANTTPGSTGNGGNISIDPKTVEILDGARISADSQGTGKPGNIDIVSDELLLLRRGGTISTNSAQDTDGGNIKINTGVLVALPKENSDITSNAVRGTGGRIDINALGIFGIVPRTSPTDLSDITANSEFGVSGTININNPEIDPNSGLIELPETVVDAKNQIAQNACEQGVGSELVATGRGGLPPSPTQDLRSSAVQVGLATPVVSNTTNTIASKPKPTPTVEKIVPAQGWVFNSKGQVVLTAHNPNQIGVQRTAHKALCRGK